MAETQSPITAMTQAVAEKQGINHLAAAYVKASGEVQNVVKDAQNPHFGSDYATLGALIDTIKPIFAKHELALLQAPGEIDGDKMNLHGLLMHSSGETVAFKMQILIGNKPSAQAVGSAITYARRYQLAAVAGVAQVDDDGEAASSAPKQVAARPKTPERKTVPADIAQLIALIQGTKTEEQLATHRMAVKEIGDKTLVDAYVNHKASLRGEKAAA